MTKKNFLHTTLILFAGCICLYLAVRFLLPVLLPFLFGLCVAWLAEPAVRALSRDGKLPRWFCAGICVLGIFVLTGTALFLLCKMLYQEAGQFTQQLPDLLGTLAGPLSDLQGWLLRLASKAPDGLAPALENGIDRLFQSSSDLLSRLYSGVFHAATAMISALPDFFLFAITAILSSFMISAQLPAIGPALRRWLPISWRNKATVLFVRLRQTLGGWFRAQLKLMSITFLIVTAGLLFLHQPFAILIGALTALVDALPVLGTGTILIPWSLILFLQGKSHTGFGLLVLYGITALARTSLEPKIVGQQIGLPPLLTLFALYAGYRLCGIWGMIFFPVGIILLQQISTLLALKN